MPLGMPLVCHWYATGMPLVCLWPATTTQQGTEGLYWGSPSFVGSFYFFLPPLPLPLPLPHKLMEETSGKVPCGHCPLGTV